MFCNHCGSKILEGERFCGNCGAELLPNAVQKTSESEMPLTPDVVPQYGSSQQPPVYQSPVAVESPKETVSPAALVNRTKILIFGIIAATTGMIWFTSILGIIFGAISVKLAKRAASEPKGLFGKAKVGRILGKIGMVFGIVLTCLVVVVLVLFVLAMIFAFSNHYVPGFPYIIIEEFTAC